MFWDKSAVPSNDNDTVTATLTIANGSFQQPVWVDTLTGGIYEIPPEKMLLQDGKVVFQDVPVYDAPTFITDRSLLTMVPASH